MTCSPALPTPARLDDPLRLATLRATGLFDAPPSAALDGLTRVATRLVGAPVALVTLVDTERQWCAGTTGWRKSLQDLPHTQSFCHRVVTSGAPLIVADTAAHAELRTLLDGSMSDVRAYAGVPLATRDGAILGAFCAIDWAPHEWAPDDVKALSDLAAAASADLEMRIALRAAAASDARYRALLHHFPDGAVFLLDATGRFVVADGQALAAAGIDPATVVGRDVRTVLPPAAADAFEPIYRAAMAGNERSVQTEHNGRVYEGQAVPVRDAGGDPVAAMVLVRDVTSTARQSAALQESEARLRLALDVANVSVWERDLATDRVTDGALPAGVPDEHRTVSASALGDYAGFLAAVHPEDRDRVAAVNADAVARCAEFTIEYRIRDLTGGTHTLHTLGRVLPGPDGRAARVIGVNLDVTARCALEAQYRQAQKMEAVGQLAGGIAHDFNNLLTVIRGNLDFVLAELSSGHPARADLAEIAHAAERARTLVRKLLTFSRKQAVRAQRVDVCAVVTGAAALLRRVIGEEIVLTVTCDDQESVVLVDPAQLEQVLMNLAVNARDAMLTPLHGHPGTGGTLLVEVDRVQLRAAETAAWDDIGPGPHVRLRVRDSGHGMDASTQAHIFEPFFTTKAVGMGTGLGLATVFGIVRQAGGAIRVESVPGEGTTFTILLPAAMTGADAAAAPLLAASAVAQQGTILLVEDETPVRVTVRRILERRGYTVLEARHGADAYVIWQAHRDEIEAVITDLRMPEVGGPELVARLRADRPALPVVFVSGYGDQRSQLSGGRHDVFVDKPFTGDSLLAALSRVLVGTP